MGAGMKDDTHNVIYFMFIGLCAGSAVTYLLSRTHHGKRIPYTVIVFLVGIIFSVGTRYHRKYSDGDIGPSVIKWSKIDPHLLLYILH